MATRSNVYVEAEPGKYLGTYCHYDGYPRHMFPTLVGMEREELLSHILVAMTRGGFRIIMASMTEYLNDNIACVMTDPSAEDWGTEFVYIKCYDGTVKWRYSDGTHWNSCYEEKNESR